MYTHTEREKGREYVSSNTLTTYAVFRGFVHIPQVHNYMSQKSVEPQPEGTNSVSNEGEERDVMGCKVTSKENSSGGFSVSSWN